jgi:hypothetical protein
VPVEVYYNIRSQISRAIVAMLIQEGAGTIADVLPLNSVATKTLPNTVVHPGVAKEVVRNTGTYSITVLIKLRGSASENVGATAEIARPFFDERAAKTFGVLRRSNDGESLTFTTEQITAAGRALKTSANRKIAAANLDMDQFSCLEWEFKGFGDGQPLEDGAFEEIFMFEAICCSSDCM